MNTAVPEATLSALFHVLGEQALLAMGVPHPMLKEQHPANPQVARFFVNLLAMVQDKTAGRRSAAEDRELEELLYQLRMRALDLNSTAARTGNQGA